MNKYLIYAVIGVIVIELFGILLRFRAKKRLEQGGSRWDVEKYIDLKKLLLLTVIGAGLYLMFPYVKNNLEQNFSGMAWLLNGRLLVLVVSLIGLLIVTELLYKLVLVRFIQNQGVTHAILRLIYWGIFIYFAIGFWPFGREAVERFRNSVEAGYEPKTAAERERIDKIKKTREILKQIKSESSEGQ